MNEIGYFYFLLLFGGTRMWLISCFVCSVFMSVLIFLYLSVCTVHCYICPSVHCYICPSEHCYICPSVHCYICPSVHCYICPSVHCYIYPSVHCYICPSEHCYICPSLHCSICPFALDACLQFCCCYPLSQFLNWQLV